MSLKLYQKLYQMPLKTRYKENQTIEVKSKEIGIETIEEWYRSSKASIFSR